MAKVPLVPDNALLRTFIKSIEDPEDRGPVVSFVRVRFQRPEFQIWHDSDPLRDAAKLALIADLTYLRFCDKHGKLKRLIPKVRARMKALVMERDQLFEDYEFLRRLMASDNIAIQLKKSK